MNGGSRIRGQADGFGLEILPKLKDVKSRVGPLASFPGLCLGVPHKKKQSHFLVIEIGIEALYAAFKCSWFLCLNRTLRTTAPAWWTMLCCTTSETLMRWGTLRLVCFEVTQCKTDGPSELTLVFLTLLSTLALIRVFSRCLSLMTSFWRRKSNLRTYPKTCASLGKTFQVRKKNCYFSYTPQQDVMLVYTPGGLRDSHILIFLRKCISGRAVNR